MVAASSSYAYAVGTSWLDRRITWGGGQQRGKQDTCRGETVGHHAAACTLPGVVKLVQKQPQQLPKSLTSIALLPLSAVWDAALHHPATMAALSRLKQCVGILGLWRRVLAGYFRVAAVVVSWLFVGCSSVSALPASPGGPARQRGSH